MPTTYLNRLLATSATTLHAYAAINLEKLPRKEKKEHKGIGNFKKILMKMQDKLKKIDVNRFKMVSSDKLNQIEVALDLLLDGGRNEERMQHVRFTMAGKAVPFDKFLKELQLTIKKLKKTRGECVSPVEEMPDL